MLPLSMTVSLLLMLSSLSLQALALQGRSQEALGQRRRLLEDQLMAAAQQLAGALQRRHRCLLTLADGQWAAAGCASAADLQTLRQGVAGSQAWQLLHYQPQAAAAGTGRAELLLRGADGGPAAAYALHWRQQDGPQLLGLQELGLRGVQR